MLFFSLGGTRAVRRTKGELEKWLEDNVRRLRLRPEVEAYKDQRTYKNANEQDSKDHAELMIDAINAEEKREGLCHSAPELARTEN